jgi:hypothetical protein
MSGILTNLPGHDLQEASRDSLRASRTLLAHEVVVCFVHGCSNANALSDIDAQQVELILRGKSHICIYVVISTHNISRYQLNKPFLK